MGDLVEAAGGLVWRDAGGGTEVLVVHRPRYDDWSLPKGKLDDGEDFAAAALREVAEETGLRCELGEELPEVRYVAKGKPKVVRYWTMTVLDGELAPENLDEVDELRWVPAAEAVDLLTYGFDAALVRRWWGERG